MSYITTTELSARLGATMYARLTDRVNGVTADENVGHQIINEAEAEANSYLGKRYATPVDLNAHPELRDLLEARVLDLAEHHAWKGSPFVSDPPQRVARLYAQALQWLEQVATGQFALPAATPPRSTTAVDDDPRATGTPRVFTSQELDGL